MFHIEEHNTAKYWRDHCGLVDHLGKVTTTRTGYTTTGYFLLSDGAWCFVGIACLQYARPIDGLDNCLSAVPLAVFLLICQIFCQEDLVAFVKIVTPIYSEVKV